MHSQQEIAIVQRFNRYSIIQILCIGTVYGHHPHIPQILPSPDLFFRYSLWNLLRLPDHLVRKILWQLVLSDDGQDIRPHVVLMPQHLLNAPCRISALVRPLQDLGNHFVIVPGAIDVILRNKNILTNSLVVRYNKSKTPIFFKCPDNRLIGTLQNPDHLSFPGFSVVFQQSDHNPVVMHCPVKILSRKIYVFLPGTVRDQKSKALGISLQPTRQIAKQLRQGILLLFGLDEQASLRHIIQPIQEDAFLRLRNFQFLHHLIRIKGDPFSGRQQTHNSFFLIPVLLSFHFSFFLFL